MQTDIFRRRVPDKRVEFGHGSIALAADWLQVCERTAHVVARRRLLIAERLAALEDRRDALAFERDS